ncbi:MAG TPA: ABC transporter permease subunit [Solirubrobacteraceae bacterium]|nr:ABC transporter permease subunit [Solirubrobacteraceae bacterium]
MTSPRGSARDWPLADRLALGACWAAGIVLCLIAGAIVLYMLVKGVQYLRPEMLWSRPQPELDQADTGGFLDPLVGTLLLTTMATAIAGPLGAAIAIWLTEYGRPRWLARAVESGVEIVAGTPSIVLAIFGLIFFSQSFFGFLSFTSEGGGVFGRSFIIASAMMSLIALPLVVGGTREALQVIPKHVREASLALGKTKAATIHRVLLPAARPGIATGTALGMGRIAGDTAIVVILLGGTLQLSGQGEVPVLETLRGTGSTLTSYVYVNSPAGEGNAPEKAYAAAFVLLGIVIALNFLVDLIARGGRVPAWTR